MTSVDSRGLDTNRLAGRERLAAGAHRSRPAMGWSLPPKLFFCRFTVLLVYSLIHVQAEIGWRCQLLGVAMAWWGSTSSPRDGAARYPSVVWSVAAPHNYWRRPIIIGNAQQMATPCHGSTHEPLHRLMENCIWLQPGWLRQLRRRIGL